MGLMDEGREACKENFMTPTVRITRQSRGRKPLLHAAAALRVNPDDSR